MQFSYSGITSQNFNTPAKKYYTGLNKAVTLVVVEPESIDQSRPPISINIDILIAGVGTSNEQWITYATVDATASAAPSVVMPSVAGILGVRLSGMSGTTSLKMTVTDAFTTFPQQWLSDPNTIRILQLDGGGMRGCYSMWGLQKIVSNYLQFAVPQNSLNYLFDIICGTSIGGLATLGLCFGKSALDLFNIISQNGNKIFEGGPSGTLSQIAWALNPVFSSIYSNTELQNVVNSIVNDPVSGQSRLISDIQGSRVIIPTVQYSASQKIKGAAYDKTAVSRYISNFTAEGFANGWTAKDAAMATSAAPMYLPPWVASDGGTYLDGGLTQNNTTPLAMSTGLLMKPNATRVCILSIGTGLENMGIARPTTPFQPNINNTSADIPNLNAQMALDAIAMGVTLPQEANNLFLDILENMSQIDIFKYRFNCDLDLEQDCKLDSVSDAAIAYFVSAADNTFNTDQSEINAFCEHLLL